MRKRLSLLAVLSTVLAISSRADATAVSPKDQIVFVGDSITALTWYGPLVASINATFTPRVNGLSTLATGTARAVVTGGTSATVVPGSYTPQLQIVNSGVPGDGVQNIQGAVAARITSHNPTLLVVEVGVNDCRAATNLTTFRTAYDSILDQTQTAIPSVKIMCLGVLTVGEQWTTSGGVPVWDDKLVSPPSNPTWTPWIDDYNGQISASCTNHGGTFMETRTEYLAWEVANNTPAIGAFTGLLTLDSPSNPTGVHPTPLGQTVLGGIVLPYFAISQP